MPPQSEADRYYSSLGIKVPSSRGEQVDGDKWLEDKGKLDGAEGLWRVHDDLYDFTDFIDKHPGGSMWLDATKGTDITEAFETHHISLGPTKLLQKFQVRKATTPRNSPFTFEENGFYRQLKNAAREKIKTIPNSISRRSKFMTDAFLFGYILFALISAKYCNCYLGLVSGVFLSMLTVAAHNFFHQKDSFRMYYFDFSAMSSREWRISHALSHHLYTNTILDLEIQLFEPIMEFLPKKKPFLVRYGQWFYAPIFYASVFPFVMIKRLHQLVKGNFKVVGKRFVIPFIVPILMYVYGEQTLGTTLLLWFWIITVASFQFALVGINAGHHRPDIFHDGDTVRSTKIDWGVSQLDTCMDRHGITGSHFLVLTNFGDHALHHMFPTLDHGKLDLLYPTFKEVCKKFGVELRMASQWQMIKETLKQMSNITPNPYPPGYRKKKN